jgi:hypothetical protein
MQDGGSDFTRGLAKEGLDLPNRGVVKGIALRCPIQRQHGNAIFHVNYERTVDVGALP